VRLISQYLRNSLNFKGVVMTDFIDKPSITNIFPLEEAGMRAVKAGNDIILIDNPDYIINVGTGIMEGIGNREFSEDKLIEANRRILRQKFRRSYEPSPYHEDPTESIRRMSRDSITLVRNDQNLLPFKLRDEGWVTVINPTAPNRDYLTLGECLLSRHNWVEEVQYDQAVEDLDFQEVKERSQNSDLIILVLDSRAALPEHQIGWSRRVKLQGKPVVVVAMGSPYNLVQIPEITTYVVTYGYSPYSLEAVIEVMTGEVNPKGRLPVALGDLYPIGHGLSYPGGANVQ
jgi:beta-N-acetylhexosaminidase